jgi:hypothetical protein
MTTTPDWLLERLAAGDLPAAEADALRRRLAAEPDGEARLAALDRSDADILAAHPPERVAAEIVRRARPGARAVPGARRSLAWATAGAMLAAAAVILFVALRPGATPKQVAEAPEVVRDKGNARIIVHRKSGEKTELLADGARAGEGDVIQLSYTAGGARYGLLISVDGRGVVTQHLPEDGQGVATLAGGAVALPHAYQLDDAPRGERFFFITSDKPFAVAPVLDAARAVASGDDDAFRRAPLSLALHQTSFFLSKVKP